MEQTEERRQFERESVFMSGIAWCEGNPAMMDIRIFDVSLGGIRARMIGKPTGRKLFILLDSVNDVLCCVVRREQQSARDAWELGVEILNTQPVSNVPWPAETEESADQFEPVSPEDTLPVGNASSPPSGGLLRLCATPQFNIECRTASE